MLQTTRDVAIVCICHVQSGLQRFHFSTKITLRENFIFGEMGGKTGAINTRAHHLPPCSPIKPNFFLQVRLDEITTPEFFQIFKMTSSMASRHVKILLRGSKYQKINFFISHLKVPMYILKLSVLMRRTQNSKQN